MARQSKEPGLCGSCEHARVVINDRGARFWLCRAAGWNPDLRKYPRIPVLRCPSFSPEPPENGAGTHDA